MCGTFLKYIQNMFSLFLWYFQGNIDKKINNAKIA